MKLGGLVGGRLGRQVDGLHAGRDTAAAVLLTAPRTGLLVPPLRTLLASRLLVATRGSNLVSSLDVRSVRDEESETTTIQLRAGNNGGR